MKLSTKKIWVSLIIGIITAIPAYSVFFDKNEKEFAKTNVENSTLNNSPVINANNYTVNNFEKPNQKKIEIRTQYPIKEKSSKSEIPKSEIKIYNKNGDTVIVKPQPNKPFFFMDNCKSFNNRKNGVSIDSSKVDAIIINSEFRDNGENGVEVK